MSGQIAITHCPISTPKEQILPYAKNDPVLIEAIESYKKRKIDEEDIFDQKYNIIITSSGYYSAFYMDDLEKDEFKQ